MTLIPIGCYSQNLHQSFDTYYKNVLTTGAMILTAVRRKPRKVYSHEWVSFVDIKRTETNLLIGLASGDKQVVSQDLKLIGLNPNLHKASIFC